MIKCPFCGSEMEANHVEFSNEPSHTLTALRCNSCGAYVQLRGNDGESTIRALNDRLVPEGMEWPKWNDGEKVKFGDTFRTNGTDDEVNVIQLDVNGSVSVFGKTFLGSRIERCSHVLPDTQERIEHDALTVVYEYWGDCRADHGCDVCKHGFEATGRTCHDNMVLDLLRRQRELCEKQYNKESDVNEH